MSLQTRLEALAAAIGADIKSLRAGTFSGNVTGQTGVYDGTVRVYSDANPPETFMRTVTAVSPPTPPANQAVESIRGKRAFIKFSDGVELEISGSVQQYATTLTTSATTYTIAHNLGTRDVMVQIYEASGNYEQVWATVRRPTINSVTLHFATAPTANQYRVVVQGKAD